MNNQETAVPHVQQIAQTLGIIVGAASCCEEVTVERVNAVAVKLREHLAAAADNNTDADLANEELSAALEMGKTAVESEEIDPEQAEIVLSELEEEL